MSRSGAVKEGGPQLSHTMLVTVRSLDFTPRGKEEPLKDSQAEGLLTAFAF